MDFDLAIRASRNDLCYWEEEDLEACLALSMEMSASEEKSMLYNHHVTSILVEIISHLYVDQHLIVEVAQQVNNHLARLLNMTQ